MTPDSSRSPSRATPATTVPGAPMTTDPGPIDVQTIRPGPLTTESGQTGLDRYAARGVLGEGGMGEVRLYHDRSIGRDVAMKVLLPSRRDSTPARHRFIREAIVQGQLEHPSIVPVYEIGYTDIGDPYFTMKRVRGETLEEIIGRLGAGEAHTLTTYPRRRLLAALAQACLAVDFAHSRGVVHRDLKPANIMLGPFGELYVLDWGIAQLSGARGQGGQSALDGLAQLPGTDPSVALGTPRYMPPEQASDPSAVDGRADVYALGAILFELLTLAPLNPHHSRPRALACTLRGVDVPERARELDADLPPELEGLVVAATSLDPDDRLATARELHDGIQRWLEGASRREHDTRMARVHARAARAAARRARKGDEPTRWHTWAIREAGRALALDPSNRRASRTLLGMLLSPPKVLPPEVQRRIDRDANLRSSKAMRALTWARYVWLLFLPLLFWMGMPDPKQALWVLGIPMLGGLAHDWVARHAYTSARLRRAASVALILSIAPIAVVFGPLFVLPLVVAASVPAIVAHVDRTGRAWVTLAGVATVIIPVALEWAGRLPSRYVFSEAGMTISPQWLVYPETPTRLLLLCIGTASVVISAQLVGRTRDALHEAEATLHRQTWQLRQLLPLATSADPTSGEDITGGSHPS